MQGIYSFVLFAVALIPFVSAHGFVSQITIDGKTYNGNVPNGKSSPSIIRQISKIDPVKGADNPNLNCGQNAQKASLVADANPGSSVTFKWVANIGMNWPHNTGPLMTYMASCGDTTCDKFDSTTAKWFKVDEAGYRPDGKWRQEDLFEGKPYTMKLPENIAPGEYLIRHEIIALHLAEQVGGAEFYPSCSQVKIGGNGNGVPTETVSFPGAYKDTDPGIFDKNAYDSSIKYPFPGPALADFAASGSGSSNGNQTATAPTGTASPSAKPTGVPVNAAPSPPVASSKSCKSGSKKRMVKRHLMHSSSH